MDWDRMGQVKTAATTEGEHPGNKTHLGIFTWP
jgi:hypothetical protein